MCMARCTGWCRGSRPICLARIDGIGGLNAPHLILGKIFAQAYDTAAYKIAADDLLASHKVDILFHALGAGVVMDDDRRIHALMVETKAGRQAVRANIFIDCSGDGDLAAWAGAPFEVGDNKGSMLYPLDDVPAQRHRSRKGGRRLADHSGADGAGRSRRHAQISAQGRDRAAAEVRRSNGG